jgi:hypothetical protein
MMHIAALDGLALRMLKSGMMTNKNSLYAVLVTVLFAGIIARIRAAMAKHAPVGYQDESGFHLGSEPSDKWTY